MKILKPSIPDNCRIITVSDIHANLKHFKMLLEKCGYNKNTDFLFILGDILEKGKENLATLRYVRELCQNERVILIKGNNDTMCDRMAFHDSREYFFERIKQRPHNTYLEMAESLGIDSLEENFEAKRERVNSRFKDELDFMKNLPLAIETKDFIFIHAGIENRPDWQNTSEKFALTRPWFFEKEHQAEKTVICGHYPTYNYKADNDTDLPIFDKERRIICIDGGASTKWAGQLNALIINYRDGKYSFETVFQPIGEEMRVKAPVASSRKPLYLNWENQDLTVIGEQEDFLYVKINQTDERGLIAKSHTGQWDGKIHGWINLNSFLSANIGEKFYRCGETEKYFFGISEKGQVGFLPKTAF